MRKFYYFRQNNSGGSFVVDKTLCVQVYIEADTAEEANKKAEMLGIYFNGCDKGLDCSCCGDRWYRVREDAYSIITDNYMYGNKLFERAEDYVVFVAKDWINWGDPMARIYYQDGTVASFAGRVGLAEKRPDPSYVKPGIRKVESASLRKGKR